LHSPVPKVHEALPVFPEMMVRTEMTVRTGQMARMEPLDLRVLQVHREPKVPPDHKAIQVFKALRETTDKLVGISTGMV
jgi:hypothetical protein